MLLQEFWTHQEIHELAEFPSRNLWSADDPQLGDLRGVTIENRR